MALRIHQLFSSDPVTIGDRLQNLWKVLNKAGKSGNIEDHYRSVDKSVDLELAAFSSFLEELRPSVKKRLLSCPSPGTSNGEGGTYTLSDMLTYLGTQSNQRCVDDASKKLKAILESDLNSWLFEISIKDVILPKKRNDVNDEKKYQVLLVRKDSDARLTDEIIGEKSRVDKPETDHSIEKDKQQKQVSNPSCCVWLKIITGAVMLIGSAALLIIFPHLVAAYASLKFTLGVTSLIGIGLFSSTCYEICTRESQERESTPTNRYMM